MSDIEPINDEWLRDIKGLAYRDADGPQVSVSRGGMKRLIARLEVAESLLAAAGAARGEQSDTQAEVLPDSTSEASWQPQVMSIELVAQARKLKAIAPYIPGPTHAPPICIDGQRPMTLMSYVDKLAVYVCEHCQKRVAVGEGRT